MNIVLFLYKTNHLMLSSNVVTIPSGNLILTGLLISSGARPGCPTQSGPSVVSTKHWVPHIKELRTPKEQESGGRAKSLRGIVAG